MTVQTFRLGCVRGFTITIRPPRAAFLMPRRHSNVPLWGILGLMFSQALQLPYPVLKRGRFTTCARSKSAQRPDFLSAFAIFGAGSSPDCLASEWNSVSTISTQSTISFAASVAAFLTGMVPVRSLANSLRKCGFNDSTLSAWPQAFQIRAGALPAVKPTCSTDHLRTGFLVSLSP